MNFADIQKYQFFISSVGRREIVNEIHKYKSKYGEKWLKAFKADYPDLVVIIDLIANYDAQTAFEKFKLWLSQQIDSEIGSAFLRITAKITTETFLETNKEDVFKLHSELKAEIDKPRL